MFKSYTVSLWDSIADAVNNIGKPIVELMEKYWWYLLFLPLVIIIYLFVAWFQVKLPI